MIPFGSLPQQVVVPGTPVPPAADPGTGTQAPCAAGPRHRDFPAVWLDNGVGGAQRTARP